MRADGTIREGRVRVRRREGRSATHSRSALRLIAREGLGGGDRESVRIAVPPREARDDTDGRVPHRTGWLRRSHAR